MHKEGGLERDIDLYVLNRLLEQPIDSMSRARLLDKKSSI